MSQPDTIDQSDITILMSINAQITNFYSLRKLLVDFAICIEKNDNVTYDKIKEFFNTLNLLFEKTIFDNDFVNSIIQEEIEKYSGDIEGFSKEKTVISCILFKFSKQLLDIAININVNSIFDRINNDNISNNIVKYIVMTRIEQFIIMIKQSILLYVNEITQLKKLIQSKNPIQTENLIKSGLFIELSNELALSDDLDIKRYFDRLDAINLELKNSHLKSNDIDEIVEMTHCLFFNFIANNKFLSDLYDL